MPLNFDDALLFLPFLQTRCQFNAAQTCGKVLVFLAELFAFIDTFTTSVESCCDGSDLYPTWLLSVQMYFLGSTPFFVLIAISCKVSPRPLRFETSSMRYSFLPVRAFH